MNRNRYRLVFSPASRMMVPVAETARSQRKTGRTKATCSAALMLTGILLTGNAQAELPVPSATFGAPGTTANYQFNAMQAYINQVGNKAVVNFDKFNISAGHDVRFQQVDSLAAANLVPGANFSVLGRIHDNNPSIIAGSISQGASQKANVILVNSNGIAFMGGSQVNLNSFTASSLNIADTFILDSFLQSGKAQFEGSGGFIKVFDGARITAGSEGRVMLIAPTVINKGKVEAPDGQIITAASTKVYLRASDDNNVRGLLVEIDSPDGLRSFDAVNTDVKDGVLEGQTVSLTEAAIDKLGHVTNLGELTTPRGNVTMVGYSVNQLGIARATSSVVSNGSVYLLAKDTTAEFNKNDSLRGGRVTLGAASVTEVMPELADTTVTQDTKTGEGKGISGMVLPSRVLAIGQELRMAGGALINAPSGQVDLVALDNPSVYDTIDDPINVSDNFFSNVARVHIADGARINVAGLENVQVTAARNSVEIEFRGDELKDSPVNQLGSLRGQKAYVDINRALANANAGKPTLIAKDSLESYQARLERTAAERSTAGGKVNVRSQGTAILESGAIIDLSGGSVQYTAATLKTTLLSSGGKVVDLADASAEIRYDGIATRYVKDYGRWNVKEVIDLGQSFRHDPGYVEGKDAGALSVIGMKAVVMQADVQGRTITGDLQREAGNQPLGAKLTLGKDLAGDKKLNQRVEITSSAALLPTSFGFGETLPLGLAETLALNPSLVGKDKIAQLEIFSNQAAEVREVLRTPQGGSVAITAKGVAINADVIAQSGRLSFQAKDNTVNKVSLPINVSVADGVTLSARGGWVNDLPAATGASQQTALVNGGSITLSAAGDVYLEQNSVLDVGGGGRLKPDGKLANGNGGNVTVDAVGSIKLRGEVRGYALGKGGAYTLKTNDKIQIGGVNDPAALNLDAGFFARGGFADFNLSSSSGIDIADGTIVRPTVQSVELLQGYTLQPTGSPIEAFSRVVVREDRVRQTANLALTSSNNGSLALGTVRLGEEAKILADDRAKVAFTASKRIELLGEVHAAGGSIVANLSRSESNSDPFEAASALWLGPQAVLDTSGAARTYTDSRSLTQGEVLNGGSVTLNAPTGYIVTSAGSRIDVSGAAPVLLDVPNERGGLGRIVASDAGTVTIASREGMLLDGAIDARAGSAANRGGTFNLTLGGDTSSRSFAAPTNERMLTLAQTVVPLATGLMPGDAVPDSFNGNTRIGTQAMEDAGFDRLNFGSSAAIRLENGLNLGANRPVVLRELKLDTGRVETEGGNAALRADTIRFVNSANIVAPDPVAGVGTLSANARLLEFSGNTSFTGMNRVEFTGNETIRYAANGSVLDGTLKTAADLVFHGAVIAPATAVQYKIEAAGRQVSFTRNTDTPIQPLSAFGSLTVKAKDIVQDGNLWAPFGQLNFEASHNLVFQNGSLTSVAATPGSLLPYGRIENGRKWVYGATNSGVEITDLPQKAIRTEAASIDMQSGAKMNLAGGGDLQAYEFTVGPGGSRDILTDKNTYAILPGDIHSFAPGDASEVFDRVSGEAIYLSGVPGLKDGVYTLMPAHYALLPGAYAVKLDTGLNDVLPGQAYSRQDGVRIAAGYVTDTRVGAPKDARWQGVQVLTHEQVRARSELALTRASNFFADSRNRPQDAGLLSINTTGSGADALKLDAIYKLAAGQGGRGAQVDISAQKLVVTSGTPAGLDPEAVVLDAGKLNALGVDSLFIGGTRTTSTHTTTLTVGAESVTLANDAAHTLKAAEIMLAAQDTLTLKSGSVIDAQGEEGDAGAYETAGNGAFVRAASTSADFSRSGSPDQSKGTLIGEPGSQITAADSITLDATKRNAYRGTTIFSKNGAPVPGNLGVGAERVNFGTAPDTAEGITYSQTELNAFSSLKSLTLSSYNTFDLYGGVRIGGTDTTGKPTLQNLTLQGAGLAGIDNAGQTAQLNAQNLTLANPQAAAFTTDVALISGKLEVNADTLTLGKGDKAIKGFNEEVTITANELVGSGIGTLAVIAPVTLNVARISGERGADQTFNSSGVFKVAQHTADRVLAPVTALGAKWALQGTSVDFDSHAELPSGTFKLTATATGGHVTLGGNARIDVAGRSVAFFDVTKPSWGGTAEFVSDAGNVNFNTGAKVDVSAAAGGDAGTVIVRATNGSFTLADGSVSGAAPKDVSEQRGEGARALIDVQKLDNFSTINTALNTGGFDGERDLRARTGNVSIAASDKAKALNIRIAADGGALDVAGTLDASGEDAGRIELFAKNDVNIFGTASLNAVSSGANEDGGDIEIGSREGFINLPASDTGKGFNVAGGAGGQGGSVLFRAQRTGGETDVAVSAVESSITGQRSIAVEAVRVYETTMLDASNTNSATVLGLGAIKSHNTAFEANYTTIKDRLETLANPTIRILSGVEVRSIGDLALGTGVASTDWNLSTARAGGEAGVLTLRADGNLKINSNLSDGFNVATSCAGSPCPASGTVTPATLRSDNSWSYRLIAGADSAAANPLAVKAGNTDFTLAAGKLIRTGTGDIRIASGRNIVLADNKSAIYTAGRLADPVSGFTAPTGPSGAVNFAQFSQGGGDVRLAALGDILGSVSTQLYTNWLFRQGRTNTDATAYTVQPAWWVRFDQFQQGVGALGGGDISIVADGNVQNLSASAPTQARMGALTPDATALKTTGGGDVRVQALEDVLAGQYYSGRGQIDILAGGKISSAASNPSRYTILGLGDAQAKVRASGDANIHAVVNPHLIRQSVGSTAAFNAISASDSKWS